MHIPILNQKLQKPSAGFCNPEKNTPVFLSWSPGPKKTFQRICIVSQRWHSNCLKDAGWCLPLLYRVGLIQKGSAEVAGIQFVVCHVELMIFEHV